MESSVHTTPVKTLYVVLVQRGYRREVGDLQYL